MMLTSILITLVFWNFCSSTEYADPTFQTSTSVLFGHYTFLRYMITHCQDCKFQPKARDLSWSSPEVQKACYVTTFSCTIPVGQGGGEGR